MSLPQGAFAAGRGGRWSALKLTFPMDLPVSPRTGRYARATPSPAGADPAVVIGLASKHAVAGTGFMEGNFHDAARRGGNPAWRPRATGTATRIGKRANGGHRLSGGIARKGPAFRPVVASLPGDAMEGSIRLANANHFQVSGAVTLPGRQVSFAGRKALGPWSLRA